MSEDELIECPMKDYVPLTDGLGGEPKWGPPPDYYVKQIREQERKKYEAREEVRRNREHEKAWVFKVKPRWLGLSPWLDVFLKCGRCKTSFHEQHHQNEILNGGNVPVSCPKCGHSMALYNRRSS